jgi:hypothetical protein
VSIDVPAVLSASAGAIPTLLLALVLQRPLLAGLVRVAHLSRTAVLEIEQSKLARLLLTPVATGPTILRNLDYTVIGFGGLGTFTSVALQAVPDKEWTGTGGWAPYAEPVLWFHLVVVAALAVALAGGLLALTRSARASFVTDTAPGPDLHEA